MKNLKYDLIENFLIESDGQFFGPFLVCFHVFKGPLKRRQSVIGKVKSDSKMSFRNEYKP